MPLSSRNLRLPVALVLLSLAALRADDELQPVCGPDSLERVLAGHRQSVRILELTPRPGPELVIHLRVEHQGSTEFVCPRLTLCLAVDGLPSGVKEIAPALGEDTHVTMRFGRFPPGAPPPPARYELTARVWIEDPPGSGRQARGEDPGAAMDTARLDFPGGRLRTLSESRATGRSPPPGSAPVPPGPDTGHSYAVVTVDAVPDGNFRYRLFAVVTNLGTSPGPPVPVRFTLDAAEGFEIPLRPAETELSPVAPGEERTVEATLDLGGVGLEERELLVGLTGDFAVEAGDAVAEDDRFPWVIQFSEFGY